MKIVIVFLLLSLFINAQPSRPGSLTLELAIDGKPVRYGNVSKHFDCTFQSAPCRYGFALNDNYSLEITTRLIENPGRLFSFENGRLIIYTHARLNDHYAIPEITIIKNNSRKRMRVSIEDGNTNRHYLLKIPFQKGDYVLRFPERATDDVAGTQIIDATPQYWDDAKRKSAMPIVATDSLLSVIGYRLFIDGKLVNGQYSSDCDRTRIDGNNRYGAISYGDLNISFLSGPEIIFEKKIYRSHYANIVHNRQNMTLILPKEDAGKRHIYIDSLPFKPGFYYLGKTVNKGMLLKEKIKKLEHWKPSGKIMKASCVGNDRYLKTIDALSEKSLFEDISMLEFETVGPLLDYEAFRKNKEE